MRVAILYSGGKDSTFAIDYAKEKGWEVVYLLSVKPTRTDCYLFHYATVEHTTELAKILNIPHILITCEVADPKQEAELVKTVVGQNIEENPIDAMVLGGTGLQETQLKSVRDALFDLGVEVFACHKGRDHEEILNEMIDKGYEIIITQFATEGLDEKWLGKRLDENSVKELKKLSDRYGFHIGGEGGPFDTLVLDGPIFDRKLNILESEAVLEDKFSGHLIIKKLEVLHKPMKTKTYTSLYRV